MTTNTADIIFDTMTSKERQLSSDRNVGLDVLDKRDALSYVNGALSMNYNAQFY